MGDSHDGLTLVFYDGMCGLCDRFVHFLLRHDRESRLRFAPLQGDLAVRELMPRGHDPRDLDTVFVLAGWKTSAPRVLTRSRAVLHAIGQLGSWWRLMSRAGSIVPEWLGDRFYGAVARRRYSMFGRFETCPMPEPEWRARFVDAPADGTGGP